MGADSKKNTKWIILGSVVFLVAVLVAVGPVMITKYMRSKWENTSHYKTSYLLMNVSGELNVADDGIYYLKGDNGLFYVLEDIKEDVSDKIKERCTILGNFREAKNGEKVAGNPVRLFMGVQEITFPNSNLVEGTEQEKEEVNGDYVDTAKEKALARTKLRVEVNTVLNKPIFFDAIKGKVSSVNRKDKDGNEYVAYILSDDMGDNYMLYDKKVKDFSPLINKEIIVLGREIVPPSNFFLIVDETTFEVYEIYDLKYNKLL